MNEQIKALRAEIERLNHLYYNVGESDVSDEVYDSLKHRLLELEGGSDDPYSPLNQVGAPSDGGFTKVKHLSPMLSLANVYSEEELTDWIIGLGYPAYAALEYKFDGASMNLIYENGKLRSAVTRGNGEEGDDITDNAVYFEGVPVDIGPIPGIYEIRGECIIPHHHFRKACELREKQGKKVYANPRNMVAGLMRKKEGSELQGLGIRFVAYDVITHHGAEPQSVPLTHVPDEVLGKFHISEPVWTGLTGSLEQIMETISDVTARRNELDFDIDGLVLKLLDPTVRANLGRRSTSPRWAVAYKFEAQTGTSVLESIDVQVGRTGVLTPVAKIKPVKLCGVTISSVTLHNFDEIARLDLRLGDTVIVSRRGDVIPKIEGVVKSLRTDEHGVINPPLTCPCCGGPVMAINGGVELFCINGNGCADQIVNRMTYFVSRDGIDVKHLGDAATKALIEAGFLGSFSSLFHLSEEDFYLAGIGEAMTDKILASIEKVKKIPFYKVLRAVGISEVGDATARNLAAVYPTFEALSKASYKELWAVPDVGPKVALNIMRAFTMNGTDLLALDKILTYTDEGIKKAEVQDLAGKTVVVTGSDFEGKSRKEMEEEVISRGAKLTKSVSKNTDYIYVGTGAGPDKIAKAKELNFVEDGIRLVNPKTIHLQAE